MFKPASHPWRSDNQNGQSLVELAVSLVILFLLLAGIVDIGRVFFTYIALRDAAQEGAAYGSAHPTHCTQIRERVRTTSRNPVDLTTLSDGDIQISTAGLSCETAVALNKSCAPNEIRVEVVLTGFPLAMPFMGAILGSQTLTLRAGVSDNIVVSPCSTGP